MAEGLFHGTANPCEMGARDPHHDVATAFRHVAQFLVLALLVLVAVELIKPAYYEWLTPPPPLEIGRVSDETARAVFDASDCCPIRNEPAERRSILEGSGLLGPYQLHVDETGTPVQPDADRLFERVVFHGHAVRHAQRRAGVIGWLFLSAVVALLNRRIGYSPFHALLMLIPFVFFFFFLSVLWRHSSPTRYWEAASLADTQPLTEPLP